MRSSSDHIRRGKKNMVFENACAQTGSIRDLIQLFYCKITRCKLEWKWSPLFIIQSKKYNNYKIPYLFTTYGGFTSD